ncbi:MAG: hypothetical protein EKK55_14855 [Rhodocyclaceae bacterium]|nr:MAG: hypothetical protein EKK55_14855 [Rhodocyclaceae bacterium]
MASRTLEITFIGNPKPVQDAFDKVGQSSDGFSAKISGAKGALGGVAEVAGGIVAAGAVQQIGGFLIDAGKAAAEDAAATARLEQALRNSSGSFDENLKKVNDRIDAGQKLAFSDDDVRDSFQQLLAATGDTDEALRRQSLAMDLSRGAGISLEAASRMVGKVTDENVQAFKRMGITIQDGASEAEALAAVQAKFAGQSETYAASTAGQFEQAKIRMDELKEQLGTALLPAFTAFANVMLTKVLPAVEDFANVAGPKIKEFAQNVRAYWESDIRPALDSLMAAWQKLSPVIIPILEGIGTHIKDVATILKDTVSLILAIISGDWGRAWDDAKKLVGDFLQLFKDDMNAVKDAITAAIPLAVEAAKNLGSGIANGIGDALGDTWTAIRDGIFEAKDKAIAGLGNAADWLVGVGWDIIRGLARGITDAAGDVLQGALNAVTDKIPDWKGPAAKDAQLLYDTGRVIIAGLSKGIEDAAGGELAATLTALTDDIAKKVRDATAKAAAAVKGGGSGASIDGVPLQPVSSPGGMGNPSVNYQDPRGVTLTADDIYNMRQSADFGFVGAKPSVVINIQNANMTDQASANRTLTNALRAAGAA